MSESKEMERTRLAVERQLAAIGAPCFEVGVFHVRRGMMLRTWRAEQVLRNLHWLRRQNALGDPIYVRPAESLGIVLLDDLDALAVSVLRRDGLEPAAVVETSPGNYQCWIRLLHNPSRQKICPALIRCLLAQLAAEYRADPCCIDWRHFGRLSGFTNPKPRHIRSDGRQPFVLLRYAEPLVATRGRHRLLQIRRAEMRMPPPSPCAVATECSKSRTYAERQKRILRLNRNQPWALDPDVSRMDFMIACEMLREGHHPHAVAHELETGSPSLMNRKNGRKDDYLHRTLQAAMFTLHPLSRPSP